MSETFKPMLATNVDDFSKLRFPALVSPKLDGVRATVQNGQLLSRSLKPIPNKNVQEMFKGLPEGLDGELIVGNPTDDPYRKTVSVVMSDDKSADGVKFYVFDKFGGQPFTIRHIHTESVALDFPDVVIQVPHFVVNDLAALEACEKEFLARGYEGLMYRDPNGPYKNGRSSEREGWLLKVKRFQDAEAVIVSCYEEMENTNEAFTNELGRTARSSAKAGKVGKGRLGGFHVLGMAKPYEHIPFDVASGAMCHEMREELWAIKDDLAGKTIVYKYFPTGGDTRPRHPIFKGFRDTRDL
jgi:DNA ligase 1